MSAEPRNAATERLAVHVAVLHKTAELPRDLYTEDFVSEDRRRLVGVPTVGLDGFARNRRLNLELGAVSGSTERVLAVAGERCCCVEHVSYYVGGQVIEAIHVLQFNDAVDRLRRLVIFDIDAREEALAELERLHTETG